MSMQDLLSGSMCGCAVSAAKVEHYKVLCKTDPAKVLDAIRVDPDHPLATADYQAARGAVIELVAVDDNKPGDPEAWSALVDAGIVDVLIDNVLYREVPPCLPICATRTDPEEASWENVLLNRTSPYWKAFQVLSYAPNYFSSPRLTARDKTVLSTMKSRWPSIAHRLWTHPYRTLQPEDTHVYERSGITVTLEALVSVESDPSFIEAIYENDTIPVIARFWLKSGTCPDENGDAFATTRTLSHFSEFAWDRLLDPSAAPSKVTLRRFIKQASIGVSSHIKNATEAERLDALLDAFGTRFLILNGDELEHAMTVASILLSVSHEMKVAALKNEKFWIGLFSIPGRVLKGTAVGYLGVPTEKRKMITPFVTLTTLLERTPAEMHDDLIRSCLRGQLFEVLDEVIKGMLDLERAGVVGAEGSASEILARIFSQVMLSAGFAAANDDMKTLLGAQFPRWRTLFALLKFYVEISPAGPVPNLSSGELDLRTLSWMLFTKLQSICKPKTSCASRGCNKDGTAACSGCKLVFYCGADCQKKDWKGHRALCGPEGLMRLVSSVEEIPSRDLMLRFADALERTGRKDVSRA